MSRDIIYTAVFGTFLEIYKASMLSAFDSVTLHQILYFCMESGQVITSILTLVTQAMITSSVDNEYKTGLCVALQAVPVYSITNVHLSE